MTLRDNLEDHSAKTWAHTVLDDVRCGVVRSDMHVTLALMALGDLTVESANA